MSLAASAKPFEIVACWTVSFWPGETSSTRVLPPPRITVAPALAPAIVISLVIVSWPPVTLYVRASSLITSGPATPFAAVTASRSVVQTVPVHPTVPSLVEVTV